MLKASTIVMFLFISILSFSQKAIIDTIRFEQREELIQNSVKLKFWMAKKMVLQYEINDTLNNRLVVEKIEKNKHSIIFNRQVRDGEFDIVDINLDGVKDFVSYYHDYYVVHLLNKKTNTYQDDFQLPFNNKALNKENKLFYCYCKPSYGGRIPYSTLYSLNNYKLYCYYIIEFNKKDVYDENSKTTSIKLYKFIDGDVKKKKFIKTLAIGNCSSFSYENFWRKKYNILLNQSNN